MGIEADLISYRAWRSGHGMNTGTAGAGLTELRETSSRVLLCGLGQELLYTDSRIRYLARQLCPRQTILSDGVHHSRLLVKYIGGLLLYINILISPWHDIHYTRGVGWANTVRSTEYVLWTG